MGKITKPTLENYKKSDWFKQDAFTKTEMNIQQITAFLIAGLLFKVCGLDAGILSWMIKVIPDPL